jgi:hypothetical protein
MAMMQAGPKREFDANERRRQLVSPVSGMPESLDSNGAAGALEWLMAWPIS